MAADAGNNLAVLIDADNVSAKVIGGLMEEVANYGTASVRRLYGDFTSPEMKTWRSCLLKYSITPIQQFAYTSGKNATDGAMIIDAMDLLYTGRFSGFCLVSSDSDFTRLASRIREQGLTVHGFGERKTPSAFISACSKFIFFDVLPTPSDEVPSEDTSASIESKPMFTDTGSIPSVSLPFRTAPPTAPRAFTKPGVPLTPSRSENERHMSPHTCRTLDQHTLGALRRAILASSEYEDGFVNLAEVGGLLVRMSPDINARNYGYDRLSDFVGASGIVEMRKKSRPPAPPIALVRLK